MPPRAPTFEQAWPQIQSVPGFLVPGQERYLFDKARSLPDNAVIAEIGSLYGRSSCTLGFACQGSNRRLFCIDTWLAPEMGDLDFFPRWQSNIAARGLSKFVTPLRGRSTDILAQWNHLTGSLPIDFIFIDGDHSHRGALLDLQGAFPLIKENGWIALHDIDPNWPGSTQVWNETAAPSLTNHERCTTIRAGMKTASLPLVATPVPAEIKPDLPVHFFAEIADAPEIATHMLAHLRPLTFDWQLHLILPAPASTAMHALRARSAGRVRIYEPTRPAGWPDRAEPRNQMLKAIDAECIFWQLRPDQTWTSQQLTNGRAMFVQEPTRTAALFAPGATAWHSHPWFRWHATDQTETPALKVGLADGTFLNLATLKPFTPEETAQRALTPAQFIATLAA